MTDTMHVTEDDEPFLIQQGLLDSSLTSVREELNKVSLTTMCLDCGDPIGVERKKAVPSATMCIDCQTFHNGRR